MKQILNIMRSSMLLATAGLVACAQPREVATAWDGSLGREINFIVPDGFEGPIYIIHDPSNGEDPEELNGMRNFFFDNAGVLRVVDFESVSLRGMEIAAFAQNGKELTVRSKEFSTGGKAYRAISSWLISQTELVDWDFPGNMKPLRKQLRDRGIRGLTKSPGFDSAAEVVEPRQPIGKPMPLNIEEGQPHLRLNIENGFVGPLYLIFDPFQGGTPLYNHSALVFSVPENGVLRLRLSEDEMFNCSFILVFDQDGVQHYLRPMATTRGFGSLPISSFLVCKNPGELPSFPGWDSTSPLEQLEVRRIPGLFWPDSK